MKALLVVLAVLAAALPLRAAEAPPETMLIAQTSYWLKPYSISFIKEYWTLTLEVADFQKALPRVQGIFSAAGAFSPQPLANLASSQSERSQQLRYRLTLRAGQAALKKLKKLGTLDGPRVLPEAGRPDAAELKAKIDKLMAAKKNHAPALGRMPDVSALVDETLEHLLLVENISQQTAGELLLNMTLRQASPAKAGKP